MKTYSLSHWEHAEHIVSTNALGNRKTSALVNRLMTLSNYGSEILLQQVFMRSIPTYVQDALSNCDAAKLKSLRDQANEIMSRPRCPASAVCNVCCPDVPDDTIPGFEGQPEINRMY